MRRLRAAWILAALMVLAAAAPGCAGFRFGREELRGGEHLCACTAEGEHDYAHCVFGNCTGGVPGCECAGSIAPGETPGR